MSKLERPEHQAKTRVSGEAHCALGFPGRFHREVRGLHPKREETGVGFTHSSASWIRSEKGWKPLRMEPEAEVQKGKRCVS